MNHRLTIDETLMAIATVWADRSTCGRNHVGAVIAKDGRHIGSGYNGAPAGMPHCEHPVTEWEPHLVKRASPVPTLRLPVPSSGCKTAIHAEANAIAYCARDGISVQGATIYTTLSPCYSCAQLIIASGIVRVAFIRQYRDYDGIALLEAAGVIVDRLGK